MTRQKKPTASPRLLLGSRVFELRGVQNKLHRVIHGQTAAEVIVDRADANNEHMGLHTWTDAPHGKIQIAEPTFTEGSGAVTVTFKADVVADAGTKPHAGPSAATLTERQRAILRVLEQKPAMALREISAAFEGAPSDRRLREELLSLKQCGLVEQSGHGRGSSWSRRRRAE